MFQSSSFLLNKLLIPFKPLSTHSQLPGRKHTGIHPSIHQYTRCLSQWRILKDWSCSTSSGHKSQQIDGGSYNQGSAMGLKTGCGRGLGWDVSSRIQAYGSHHCFACSKSFQQGGD